LTPHPIVAKPPLCLSDAWFEDPFVWQDRRGWKMLIHGMCPTGVFNSKLFFATAPNATWHVASEAP